MGNTLRVVIAILCLIGASFAVNVSVSSPVANATVASPATIAASASSSSPITGWKIYVDGKDSYTGGATQHISTAISMAAGTHQIIVRAWDSTGAYAGQTLTVTAGAASSTGSGVSVSVTSPAASASVTSPVTVNANAGSGYAITGWRVYVDGVSAYSAGATSSISAPVAMASGTHQVIVRAWNTAGAYGSQTLSLSVGGTGGTQPPAADGGPTAPSNAVTFSRLEEATGWGNCMSAGCSGSSNPASYWIAQHQTTPSMDGSSTHYYVSGSAWADVLWYKHVTPQPAATHYLLDYWVKPTADTLTHAEALEFDFVQIVNGRKYDVSNQCHYSGQHWDTWDGLNLKWVHTTVPCPKMDPNAWHHIKILAERVGTQTHNISYTVDGVTRQVPTAYAWHQTRTNGSSTSQNVQVQLDTNASGGTISEYIDKLTLSVW